LQEGSPESEDEAVFRKVMTGAARKRLQQQSIGAAVAAMGRAFLGVPYVAHTLEEEGEEHLVVNLRGMDCTTFMENALVLGRCIRMNRTTFEAYREELTLVRYRGGVINGYPCRLHYFTDWVHDNARKNVLRDVTAELGGERADRRVEFMSTHPEKYRQLSRPANLEAIRTMEDAINARGFSVVPARRIKEILPRLQEGDIIGTATAIPGMDVSHVGLVIREDERPRFLHASLSGGAVWVADGTVADYVTAHPQMTGIVIARPLEPDPNR
jgi:cell wall-associated NlpC family hydrolase